MNAESDTDDTDLESREIKEVFAHFGMAIFHGQGVERQIAILLATKHGPGLRNITRDQFDDLLTTQFDKTLGKLISNIRSVMMVPEDLSWDLKAALNKRNWLAHDYFWERAVQFMTTKGPAGMIGDLRTPGESFDRLDGQLIQITYEWADANGLTREMVQEELGRLVEEAYSPAT